MGRIFLFLIVLISFQLTAQDSDKNWFLPDHTKLQFAGNIGFLSAGVGYLHGKKKLETDFYLGYLPKSVGGDHIISLTAKITYSPWKKELNEVYLIYPFSIGSYLNYSFGSQFDTILPNEYPDGYYWWASSLRFGAFIGGKVERGMVNSDRRISAYYELGTYDLKMVSYVLNMKALSVTDIFSLALGVKLTL